MVSSWTFSRPTLLGHTATEFSWTSHIPTPLSHSNKLPKAIFVIFFFHSTPRLHKEQTSLYTTNICLYFIFSNFSQRKSTLGLTNKFCSFFCRGTNNYYICIRFVTGCSAVRLARQLRELEVPGSNPGTPTNKKENIHRECSLFCLSVCTDSMST